MIDNKAGLQKFPLRIRRLADHPAFVLGTAFQRELENFCQVLCPIKYYVPVFLH